MAGHRTIDSFEKLAAGWKKSLNSVSAHWVINTVYNTGSISLCMDSLHQQDQVLCSTRRIVPIKGKIEAQRTYGRSRKRLGGFQWTLQSVFVCGPTSNFYGGIFRELAISAQLADTDIDRPSSIFNQIDFNWPKFQEKWAKLTRIG